jgi:hypothetical protein
MEILARQQLENQSVVSDATARHAQRVEADWGRSVGLPVNL